jgi:hypothetical protein
MSWKGFCGLMIAGKLAGVQNPLNASSTTAPIPITITVSDERSQSSQRPCVCRLCVCITPPIPPSLSPGASPDRRWDGSHSLVAPAGKLVQTAPRSRAGPTGGLSQRAFASCPGWLDRATGCADPSPTNASTLSAAIDPKAVVSPRCMTPHRGDGAWYRSPNMCSALSFAGRLT